MGWEKRERGGSYYVQKKRVGGKVISEYVGSGPIAELAATLDAHTRVERQEESQQRREEWRALLDEDAAIALFCADVEASLRQELEAAGYHRHDRGEWRKRRGNKVIGEGATTAEIV